LDWTEQGRGGKTEGEREGLGFKLNFIKISNRKLKNFENESCREFENIQLFFKPRVHLSHGLKVTLNSKLLGFELLIISYVKFNEVHFVRY
jgi:hypothetical protein